MPVVFLACPLSGIWSSKFYLFPELIIAKTVFQAWLGRSFIFFLWIPHLFTSFFFQSTERSGWGSRHDHAYLCRRQPVHVRLSDGGSASLHHQWWLPKTQEELVWWRNQVSRFFYVLGRPKSSLEYAPAALLQNISLLPSGFLIVSKMSLN